MTAFALTPGTFQRPADCPPSAWTGHVPFAFWVIEAMRPATMVELGTHYGTSFLAFCQAIASAGVDATASAVDTWQGDEHAGFYGEDVHDALDATVRAKYPGIARLLRMRFDEALPTFAEGSVDLLHIDGLHTYEAVRQDFEQWLPKLSRRGVVLFHDTLVRERGFGVWRLWQELSARYPAFELRHTHGLGVLLVGDQPPPAVAALCALTGTPREDEVQRVFEALGERVVGLDRAAFFEANLTEVETFRNHYRAVFERAEEGLAVAEADRIDLARHLEAAKRDAAEAVEGRAVADRVVATMAERLEAETRNAAALTERVSMAGQQAAAEAQRREAAEHAATALEERLEAAGRANAALAERAEAAERANAALAERAEAAERANAALAERAEAAGRANAALAERAEAAERANAALEAAAADARAALDCEREVVHARAEADRAAIDGMRAELAGFATQALAAEAMQQQLLNVLSLRERERDQALSSVLQGEERLRDAHTLAELRQAGVDRLLASRSWRFTAPLRWVRSCLAAVYHRRPMPAYPHMLGVPVFRVPPVRRPSPEPTASASASASEPAPAPAPAVPESTRQFLEGLFAEDASRRAPEFLPASVEPAPEPASLRAKAIAFYLPQFHTFDENEAWWGKGFTEWTNVTKAVPQFLGHHQPQLPADLGFYDLRVPEVLKRQVAMARQYGLHGFAFHYYWFAGKRLMEQPLDLYLAQEDIDFPFCLCWANENWTRRWDGHDSEILISQEHGPENDLAFIQDLEPYLRDRRYIRVDGKPLLIVYRPSILPDPAATLVRWREHCRATGIGELFIAMVQFDTEDPREHGFDAAMEFPPHKLARGFEPINQHLEIINPEYRGNVVHYQSIVDSAKGWPDRGFPLIRSVFPGWDNEARRPGKGYTFAYATPSRYREWLAFAVDWAERHPVGGERIVMVNAWNEWAEGAKLEPDRRFGHAFLQATREVLEAPAATRRVAVLSHDAHPHGGQYLALHLVRELAALGVATTTGLLGPGRLEAAFRAAAPLVEAFDEAAVEAFARRCAADGTQLVIANTAVSGRYAPVFRRQGLEVLTLVHELPGVIRQYGLERAAVDLVASSRRVVAPSEAVAKGLGEFVAPEALAGRLALRPQGLFTRSRYRGLRDMGPAREALRTRLGLPSTARIVLAIGYADHRKGVDLLVEAALLLADMPDLHVVWVGHRDVDLQDAIDRRLREGGIAARFHFPGLDFDTDDYYAGADVYALASREDPFPSVVLESLAVGTPVVAFAGTGGGADLVAEHGGVVVSPLAADAYADALRALLEDEPRRRGLGEAGRDLVDARFSFRRYAMDLLALGGVGIPKVSVVVPNYNYARYLEARLASIADQTLPVYEIIVLDDASSDASLEVLQSVRGTLVPEPRVVVNERNSGSVFRQWLRGVEMATGDFVWIAEADDLALPGLLEALAPRMAADPSLVMGYCQSEQMDPDGRTLAPDYLDYTRDISPDRWREPYVSDGVEEAACLGVKNVVPNVSAVLFRREPLLEVLRDGIEEIARYSIAGDWVVYLRLLKRGGACFEPAALNRHRRHPGSVTLGSAADRHLDEVGRAQAEARRLFAMDAGVERAANAYLDALRVHFGLAPGRGKEG